MKGIREWNCISSSRWSSARLELASIGFDNMARGFTRVQNIMGGMGAYQETKYAEWRAADLVFSPTI